MTTIRNVTVAGGSLTAGLAADAVVLAGNSTTGTLAAGASWTGTAADVSHQASVVTSVKTDQDGTLYMEFSPDGTNWDSSLPFVVTASTNEVHRLTVTRKYYRARFTNGSASNQTYIRLQSLAGSHQVLTSALNSVIQSDSDAVLTRPLDFNLMVAEGLYQNRTNTIKTGLNLDVDSTVSISSPQDLNNAAAGGAYTGFPPTSQASQIVLAGADTGSVYYSYMPTTTSTDYTIGSLAVAGAGTYTVGHSIWRCNFAYFDGGGTTLNVGNITVESTAGPGTYRFAEITAGYGESQCAAYTVPAGSRIYLDLERGAMRGASSGTMDGWWYYKESGKSPRLRWPFQFAAGALYFDEIDYLQSIPAGTDIVPRITYSSANNQVPQFKYRFVKVKS